ncbi:MAG: YdeI/OmpD-associated family protein [Spirochaetes bacterium]|nr:YdeI/OmpD-associated family protein [Spirochaetota bacterium]
MNKPNPKVDAFLAGAKAWRDEFKALRSILLGAPLTEDLKWGVPCYAYEGGNVVLMHGFKEYCALLFFKGSLLKDEKGLLVRQTENVQASRQIRFTQASDILGMRAALKAYVEEAIGLEKSGAKVVLKKTAEFKLPEEFRKVLGAKPAVKKAFEALTPGRQRAYLLHFSSAKQAQTREARIEKCLSRILAGKGLDD